MKKSNAWIALAVFSVVQLGTVTRALADTHEAKNLKILKDNGKDLEAGMKGLSKGLGVKCNACHVKGDFASDKVEAKESARTFLTAVLDEKDEAKRDAALTELLKAVKVKSVKKPAVVWEAVAKFQKK